MALPVGKLGQAGQQDQRGAALAREVSQLAQSPSAVGWLVAREEHLSARRVRCERVERLTAAVHRAGCGGQHPRDVRGFAQRDLVGLAGERAAVDDGERVAPAGVVEQQLDAVARAVGGEPRAGREHPQPVAGGGEQLPDGQAGGEELGDLAQRPWRLDAGVVGDPCGRSAGVGQEDVSSFAACFGERGQVGDRAGARAAAQPAHGQQRPAAQAGARSRGRAGCWTAGCSRLTAPP